MRIAYRRLAVPVALALVWFAEALFQVIDQPALGTELAAVLLLGPIALWAMLSGHLTFERRNVILAGSVPIAVMLVAALASANPATAVLGGAPLWQGWLLWALVFTWYSLMVIGVDADTLRSITGVLTLAGAVAGVWSVLDVLGVVQPYDLASQDPMAMFDNSLSLGQGLIVTLAATAGQLALRGRSRALRVLLWLALAVQLAALGLSVARAAWLGALVGACIFGILHPGTDRLDRAVRTVSAAVGSACMLAFAALWAGYLGLLGRAGYRAADEIASGRFEIWRSATERVSQDAGLGLGPGVFDAIFAWQPVANGNLDFWTTGHPHGIVAGWLTGAGVAGLVALGFAAVVITRTLIAGAAHPASTPALRWILAGAGATFIAQLTSWPDPLATLSISCMVGGAISVSLSRVRPADPETPRAIGWIAVPSAAVLIASVVAAGALQGDVVAHYRLAKLDGARLTEYVDALRDYDSESSDPYFVETALFGIAGEEPGAADAEQVQVLLDRVANDPEWQNAGRTAVPLLASEVAWVYRRELGRERLWALTTRFAEIGREIDPSVGVWDYVLARAAVAAKRSDAVAYIEAAEATSATAAETAVLAQWQMAIHREGQVRPPATVEPVP